MTNKNVIHPCIGCKYFHACGNTGRTEYCDGRELISQEEKEEKKDEYNRSYKS